MGVKGLQVVMLSVSQVGITNDRNTNQSHKDGDKYAMIVFMLPGGGMTDFNLSVLNAKELVMVTTRSEKDSMGPIDVPANQLWGAQTQRSLEHFRISQEKCRRR